MTALRSSVISFYDISDIVRDDFFFDCVLMRG